MPFNQLKNLLKQEKQLGVNEPECAVLATVSTEGNPHSRVVAIRKIETESLLFFTQQLSRKVAELQQNPNATLNFWFAMQQRQVILEGVATPLSYEENQAFWNSLPRERQLRFSSYAPTSGKVIEDQTVLKKRKAELISQFADQVIPMSKHYCGFRFTPHTIFFYTIGTTAFSEVIRYSKIDEYWQQAFLSP
ncbi:MULTISPECIES: pyridoxal 5'-phosphate synthase [unclassified Legionella]|uniref:pyridoxine/pyridoxamine 5'-phosphate oxidase n=1 Tax=unclassified Legionella TaxID=2622702 RepID=UPI001054FD7D|nr:MULTISPECIES: pyridoxamine 5'-phosphate oxidase family protein [unclassified Legionella]MDI9819304.1 pyridoxamine 5'-phosphate oxidase family protein [Legionella sp. PL877]